MWYNARMNFTRDQVMKQLGLSDGALDYYVDTGRIAPLESGEFSPESVAALQAGMQLFGRQTAAAYLQMPVATLKWHVHVAETIRPGLVGKSSVFTRAQLDDFRANDGQTSLEADLSAWYSGKAAAAYLGLSPSAFGWHSQQRHIAGEFVGRSVLYAKDALDRLAREHRLRPQ